MLYIMSIQHGIHDAVEGSISLSEGIDITCIFKVAHNLFDELDWKENSRHNVVEWTMMGISECV